MKYHTAQTRNKADGTECAANDGKSGKCSSGTCVAAAACTNDCQTSGIKQCYGTTSYQACGNYDADSCLEWSSSASCPSGQACLIDGICISGPYCNCLFTNQQCDFGETCNCNWGFASCDAPECFCSAHHSGYCSVGEACAGGLVGCYTPNQIGCGAPMSAEGTNPYGCQADLNLNCAGGKVCNCNEECASGVCSGGSTCSYGTCTAAGCTSDADCTDTSKPYYDPNKPKCNTATGECVECLSDPDCRNAGKTCGPPLSIYPNRYAGCDTGSTYTCSICGACTLNEHCEPSYCCESVQAGGPGSTDPQCVGLGIHSTSANYLCT